VHEGGFRVCTDAEAKAVFFSPQGSVVASAPPLPDLGPDPLQTLIDGNRARGVVPDWRSGMPEYKHDRDAPWEMEAAARDALEREPAAETVGAGVA
jgi:hypothetical protein